MRNGFSGRSEWVGLFWRSKLVHGLILGEDLFVCMGALFSRLV